MKKYMIMIILALMSVGCVQPDTHTEQKEPIKEKNRTVCTDPRPQICTREYAPVCAIQYSGIQQIYATGCVACADHKVRSYVHGACAATSSTHKPVLHLK